MENLNWTRKELEAYLLIYCANADFVEHEEEVDFIKLKVEEQVYKKMHKIFNKDNDYQSLQKIQIVLQELSFSEEEKQQLLSEIQKLFVLDDHFTINEYNLLRGLQHIFK